MAKSINRIEPAKPDIIQRKRVAAYARVSTDAERLMHSLSAQVSYYSGLIQRTPSWIYVGVYADEGITGTKLSGRTEFQRMMEDCEAGKIDIILTKSVSRFGRNTVDILNSVRRLKQLGIEVRFEKENLNSPDESSELLITLLASFAQAEVLSLSENVRWGTVKRFKEGIPNGRFRILGYRWDGDHLVIQPEEAVIVRRIFQNFLDGKSRLETEREFDAEGIRTINGCRFVDSNIKVILTNVTYTGNLLLQKEYISDPIEKKRRKNHGELPQYYVAGTHEAIIDQETFDYVQAEMARRKELGPLANKALNITCFTGKIKCEHCGCSFCRSARSDRALKAAGTGAKYVIWNCATTRRKGGHCETKDIPEYILKRVCAEALGMATFDEKAFLERVERITIRAPRTITFYFSDGTVLEREWRSTAKKDSWTPEMKTMQREWMENYRRSSSACSEFSSRIRCASCGGHYRKQSSTLTNGEKVVHWRCPNMKECHAPAIKENVLREELCRTLHMQTYDPALVREKVVSINVISATEIICQLSNGDEISIPWKTRRSMPPWSEERRKKWSETHGTKQ